MQRRAAAVYFVLFVLVGAGAYGFLGVISQPPVDLDGPTYGSGDEFSAGGVTYSVASIGDGEGELSYTNETSGESEAVDIGEGENVTLGGSTYFAHFPSNSSVQVLSTNEYWSDYQGDLATQDTYQERRAGIWAVVIMSFLAGIILLSAAYMPVRG